MFIAAFTFFAWFIFLIINFVFAIAEILLSSQLITLNNELFLSLSVLPAVKFYDDLLSQKDQIKKDNKGKSGVYLFRNKINSNCYVGSGVDLSVRLSDYFSDYYLNRLDTQTFLIVKAIKKYRLENFSLTILEYVDNRELAIEREQYYIDEIDPVYNILRFARSSLGYKHTEESKEKIRVSSQSRKHSEEAKSKMSESKIGENNPMFGKIGENNPNFGKSRSSDSRTKMSIIKGGGTIFVYDSNSSLVNSFPSARKAAEELNCDHKTIIRYTKSGKLFRDQWILSTSLK
jgi:group I intron endonuclease